MFVNFSIQKNVFLKNTNFRWVTTLQLTRCAEILVQGK
jgi:hypothetical protein